MGKFIGKLLEKEINEFGIEEILSEEEVELKVIDGDTYDSLEPFKKVVKERSDGNGYATYLVEQDLTDKYDVAFDIETNSVFAVREDLDIDELYIPETVTINNKEYEVKNFEITQSFYIEKIYFPKNIKITYDTKPDLYDLYDNYLQKMNSLKSIYVYIDDKLTEVPIDNLVDWDNVPIDRELDEYINYNMN